MATDNILKKGYLYQFRNRQEVYGWERLYFVLHGPSAKNEARLDWYESLESSQSNPGIRSGIFLEEIIRVERIAYQPKLEYLYGPKALFLFGIYTCRKDEPYVLKCSDGEMLDDWIKQLSKLLREVRQMKRTQGKAKNFETVYSMHNIPETLTFTCEVEVEETAAAKRQGIRGNYRLVLSRHHLSLTNTSDLCTAHFWHYSHVRRFGYSDRTFTVEGGQRSGPGEGLFILKNCDGRTLFNEVQEKIRLLRQTTDDQQPPSLPDAAACSRDVASDHVRAPPTDKRGDGKDTPKASRPHVGPNGAMYLKPGQLSSAALLNNNSHREQGFTADREDFSEENAHQQLDSDDDDDDSSGSEKGKGNSTRLDKKPKVPPKNFDPGLTMEQVDSKKSASNSSNKEKVNKTKTHGQHAKADKANKDASIIHFGSFKRFTCTSPTRAAKDKNRNDVSCEKSSLLKDGDDIQNEPPPVKPKNFRKQLTANNNEDLAVVLPSLPPKTKPSPKERRKPEKKASDKNTPTAKLSPKAQVTPKENVLGKPTDPARCFFSDDAMQNLRVVEPAKDTQKLAPFGPKISEVLPHLVSETGSSSVNCLENDAKASENAYNQINFRAEAGKPRTIRDASEEHLYGQSLIRQMEQRVEAEPDYEDIDHDLILHRATPKNNKKPKK